MENPGRTEVRPGPRGGSNVSMLDRSGTLGDYASSSAAREWL